MRVIICNCAVNRFKAHARTQQQQQQHKQQQLQQQQLQQQQQQQNNSNTKTDLQSSSSFCFVLLIRLALVSLLVSWLVCATRWSGQVSVAGGAGASCRSASAATRSCALKAASWLARLHLEPKHGAALAASATGHRDIEASATCAKAIGNGKRHRQQQQHRQRQQQRQQHRHGSNISSSSSIGNSIWSCLLHVSLCILTTNSPAAFPHRSGRTQVTRTHVVHYVKFA